MSAFLAQQITGADPWPLIWASFAVTFGTFGVYARRCSYGEVAG